MRPDNEPATPIDATCRPRDSRPVHSRDERGESRRRSRGFPRVTSRLHYYYAGDEERESSAGHEGRAASGAHAGAGSQRCADLALGAGGRRRRLPATLPARSFIRAVRGCCASVFVRVSRASNCVIKNRTTLKTTTTRGFSFSFLCSEIFKRGDFKRLSPFKKIQGDTSTGQVD